MAAGKMIPTPLQEKMPIEEQIRARAHQIYVERGDRPGSDVDDWLLAEREILGRQAKPPETKRR